MASNRVRCDRSVLVLSDAAVIILSSTSVLTPNQNFFIVPLLHSVSDIYIQFAAHRERSVLPLQISVGERCTVIPRLTKIIRSGIALVSRNLR